MKSDCIVIWHIHTKTPLGLYSQNEKFLMSMKTDFYFLNVSHPS